MKLKDILMDLQIQYTVWLDNINYLWHLLQADLSLRWAHSHFVGFVIARLIE